MNNQPPKKLEVNKLTKIYTAFVLIRKGMNLFFPKWKNPTIKAYEKFLHQYSIDDLNELRSHLVECSIAASKSEILQPMAENLDKDIVLIDNIIKQREQLD